MAYVRKTQTLVDEMTAKVRAMSSQAIKPYDSSNLDESSPVFDSIRAAVSNSAWSDAPELKDKMPDKWTDTVDNVHVKFVDENDSTKYSTYIECGEHKKIRIPSGINRGYYRYESTVKDEHCDETLKAWLIGEEERKTKREEIQKQYNTIERQIKQFMEGQASLNAAVKEMPELEMYVPDSYLAKPHEKTERRKKAESETSSVDEIGIDRDVFAAAAIAHRIATAGN